MKNKNVTIPEAVDSMVGDRVACWIVIYFFFYFKLANGFCLWFELLSCRKAHLDSVVLCSTHGKSRAPEAAVGSGYCGQKGMVLLGLGGFALAFIAFFLFNRTFIFFFSHDFSSFG